MDRPRLLEQGRACIRSSDYTTAAKHFKAVARTCPTCQNGKADKCCACKNLLRAFGENSLKDELRAPCRCDARSNQRCIDAHHLDALSSLVLIGLRTNQLKASLNYAQKMILISPRETKGYLRLGQVLRHDKQPALALAVYQQGASVVEQKSPQHVGLEALRAQADLVSRVLRKVDPMSHLPPELQVMVLEHLDTRSLCRCLHVAKHWKRAVESKAALPAWTVQRYDLSQRTPKGKPTFAALQRYMAVYPGGHLKDLSLIKCPWVTASNLPSILRHSPRLEHLALVGVPNARLDVPNEVKIGSTLPRLQTLFLGYDVCLGNQVLEQLVRASAATLQELSVLELHRTPSDSYLAQLRGWPELKELRTIRLSSPPASLNWKLDPTPLMRLTPGLESVWLDNFILIEDPSHPLSASDKNEVCWPQLQRVFCGQVFTHHTHLLPGPLTDQLTELHCENDLMMVYTTDSPEFPPLAASNWGRFRIPRLGRLQKLSIKGDHHLNLELPDLKQLLQPPLQSGCLEELVLDPFPSNLLNLRSEDGFSWMRSDRLAFLGIGGFNAELGRHVEDPDALLLCFVAQFSNLRSLDIGTELFRAATLVKIITQGVTRIYHRNPVAQIAEVLDWTREHGRQYGGAQLITGPWPHTPANLCDRWAVRQLAKNNRRRAFSTG